MGGQGLMAAAFRLCCVVSGHGFGHIAQTAALVNRLAAELPALQLHIISPLPRPLLARMIGVEFSLECRAQDVGLLQSDPMRIDLSATAQAVRRLHDDWSRQLAVEKASLSAWRPDLVLANIPYLPIAAAAELGIATVGVASLTWDAVLAAYFLAGDGPDPEITGWWRAMREAYAGTSLALLPMPAIVENHPFPRAELIGPLITLGRPRREALRRLLGLAEADERPVILVSLGGIPARHIPVQALAREEGFHWLLDVDLPAHPGHLHAISVLLGHWSFADLSASVDGVVSKPGYGMAVAATVQQIPFLYLRRGTFPDEPPICGWMEAVGCAMELTAAQFYGGDWSVALRSLLDRPVRPLLSANGAEQGVAHIRDRFL
ncbi:MAG: hypothetical protein HQL80_08100 [Magnetococcales bacterium]|nr:hypothetical protein [Magnetococcales bacterium]